MTKDTDIFGLMGRNPATGTAFVSFRGSSDVEDWLADLDAVPDAYLPVSGFGQVHAGFQEVYELVEKASPRTWPPRPPAAIRSWSPGTASVRRWPCSRHRTSTGTCRRTRSNLG